MLSLRETRLPVRRSWSYILVFVTASLASTILLKVAEIQYLEFIFLAYLLLLAVVVLRNHLRFQVFRDFFDIGWSYSLFLLFALLLGIYALRQDFYPYGPASLLKSSLLFTIARSVELFLDVFFMLYLASLYRDDIDLCIFGMKTYYWFGLASAAYSIFTYPLNVIYGLDLGTYFEEHRMRGFYNEGGPYGVYLISLLLVTSVMRKRGWITKAAYLWGMSIFAGCMVLSQSKSALLYLPFLGAIDLYLLLSKRGRMIANTALVCAGLLSVSLIDFKKIEDLYATAVAEYRVVSQMRPTDGNYVLGRVAGAILAPRMILAHPLAGIGWGNYGQVRNDPQYRQGTAFSIANDAPGLGPVDYIVDLGIPLWLYLIWVEFMPFRILRKRKTDLLILNLALMQPLANLFGAHLNLTYPWVVGGFALGLGCYAQPEPGNKG